MDVVVWQDGKEVSVRFEIRDMTAGGEGMQLSVAECKKASVFFFLQNLSRFFLYLHTIIYGGGGGGRGARGGGRGGA